LKSEARYIRVEAKYYTYLMTREKSVKRA